jgi:hypothetical protein
MSTGFLREMYQDGRHRMRQRSVQHWTKKLLLVAVATALPMIVFAQDRQDDPRQGGAAFAGGQMVRGTVTATAADHLTVKTDAGDIYQISLSANTRLNKERQPIKVTDIKVGDGAGAMGVLDPATKTVHAVFVAVIDAEQVKKAREGMGKVYITGKVTAIDMDALKVTVLRPDGVSQVIGVDEQTSFKRGGRGMAALASGAAVIDAGTMGPRGNGAGAGNSIGAGSGGGESITFADVKVGDSIAGRGALKNGTFVPTELGVMDPAAMGQRRRRGAEGGAGTAPSGGVAPKGAAAPASPAPSAAIPQ